MNNLYGKISLLNKLYHQIYNSEGFAELSISQKCKQCNLTNDGFTK